MKRSRSLSLIIILGLLIGGASTISLLIYTSYPFDFVSDCKKMISAASCHDDRFFGEQCYDDEICTEFRNTIARDRYFANKRFPTGKILLFSFGIPLLVLFLVMRLGLHLAFKQHHETFFFICFLGLLLGVLLKFTLEWLLPIEEWQKILTANFEKIIY